MAERTLGDPLDADRIAFFEALAEGFRRAARAADTIEKDYRVAGARLRLRFAGGALVPILDPALSHLAAEPSGGHSALADCTIELFDSASTATPLPLLVRSLVDLLRLRWWEHLDNRREISRYHGGPLRAAFHLGPDILSVLDVERRRALYWVNDASDLPYYERGYPITNLLNWWLSERGLVVVHAAVIGNASGAVLLPGKGGSGKSTTTLASTAAGLAIVGDDYCAVDPVTGVAHSLYNTVKLKADADVERFSGLEAFMRHMERVGEGDDRQRSMVHLHPHFAGAMTAALPVRAILVPRVTGEPGTTISPASAGAALKALAPSTMFQLAGNERGAFGAMADLVRRIPPFEIALGTRIDAIPAAIGRFLDSGAWADGRRTSGGTRPAAPAHAS